MKVLLSNLGAGIITVLCTIFYYNRYIDSVAEKISILIQRIVLNPSYQTQTSGAYIVAEFIVPLVWGVALGVVAAGLLENSFIEGVKTRWWIPVFCSLCSILPSIYYVVFMTFFMEGS
jgi:hypothetical protein